MYNNI